MRPGRPCTLIPASTEPGKMTHVEGLDVRIDYQSMYAEGVESYKYVSDRRLLEQREEEGRRKESSA
jgi:hypothetical protein